jgi:hypothetical protein
MPAISPPRVTEVRHDLESDRTRAGNDAARIERLHQCQATVPRELRRACGSLAAARRNDLQSCTERAHPIQLHRRRVLRHHDGRVDAEASRSQRHGDGVVATRVRHHAAGAGLRR